MPSGASIPLRVLFLRNTRDDYLAFTWWHFAFGLLITWLVGMGRYWDNPRVETVQRLGGGSFAYVFILALLLFAVGLPFRDKNWTYPRVLTMVVLSSPPAAIYALPVEKLFDFETARSFNTLFFGLVALWRMLIWGRFVFLMCPTSTPGRISVIFLPVTAILVVLAVLNLEQAVADLMSGLQPAPNGTTADRAYIWLIMLTALDVYLVFPVISITYIVAWIIHARKKRTAVHPPAPAV